MHSNRLRRKSMWLALTVATAAALIVTGCGASLSPAPDQMTASGLAGDQHVSTSSAGQNDASGADAGRTSPEAALLPAVGDSNDSGGSGNPAGPDAGEGSAGVLGAEPTEAEPDGDEFLLVADFSSLPDAVQRWHDAKREFAGAYQLTDAGQTYLLISAGAMPTGGYSLSLRSLTETDSGWRLEVELHKPSPNAMVTQVVTYPSLFFTAPAGEVEVMMYDGGQSRTLPLNAGGDVR